MKTERLDAQLIEAFRFINIFIVNKASLNITTYFPLRKQSRVHSNVNHILIYL
jgi:hypothetical protein